MIPFSSVIDDDGATGSAVLMEGDMVKVTIILKKNSAGRIEGQARKADFWQNFCWSLGALFASSCGSDFFRFLESPGIHSFIHSFIQVFRISIYFIYF